MTVPSERTEYRVLTENLSVRLLQRNHEYSQAPVCTRFNEFHKGSMPHCSAGETLSMPRDLCQLEPDENASWKRRRKRVKLVNTLSLIHAAQVFNQGLTLTQFGPCAF